MSSVNCERRPDVNKIEFEKAINERASSEMWDSSIAKRVIARKRTGRRVAAGIVSGIAASIALVLTLFLSNTGTENEHGGFISAQTMGVYHAAYGKSTEGDPVDEVIDEMISF
jgi:hypothetical protein